MGPTVRISLVAIALLFVAGVLITMLPQRRAAAAQEACKNNLRILASFAANGPAASPDGPPQRSRHEIPAGTVVLPGVAPNRRLSWVPALLPNLDQRRQNVEAILASLDRAQPWEASVNQEASHASLPGLLCPGNPPANLRDPFAPTQYVGIAGLGADAAEIRFMPPAPAPPRAGPFHYDSPTPFSAITDGLSQTLLFGEHSVNPGPWLRGGLATLRGLDNGLDALPLIGPGAQFGGNHPNTSNWTMADGSIRPITPRIDPKVLLSLATIAGGESDGMIGE